MPKKQIKVYSNDHKTIVVKASKAERELGIVSKEYAVIEYSKDFRWNKNAHVVIESGPTFQDLTGLSRGEAETKIREARNEFTHQRLLSRWARRGDGEWTRFCAKFVSIPGPTATSLCTSVTANDKVTVPRATGRI